mgnify:CR=1 FL=1
MKHYYLINKSQRDKSGVVISGHKTFQSAESALKQVNAKIQDGVVPAVIIESDRVLRKGQKVIPGEY